MTGPLTNLAAQTALQMLTKSDKAQGIAQNRVSADVRAGSAPGAGNAAYWSIATAASSGNTAPSTVEATLALGAAMIDVSRTAIGQATEVMEAFRANLGAARQPDADRVAIQGEIGALQGQLRDIASAASFSAENWVSVDSGTAGFSDQKTVVSSFSLTGGELLVGAFTIDTSGLVLFDSHHAGDATHYGLLDGGRLPADGSLAADGVGDGTPPFSVAGTANGIDVSGLTGSGSDQAVLEAYIRAADAALQELASAAAVLDSVRAQIGMQDSFLTTLGEVIDGGFGQIVDTGMNEETARARALHVQAQIGIQPLPIANVSPQGILALSA